MVVLGSIPALGEFTKIPINLFFVYGFCVHRWTPREKPKQLQFIFIFVFICHAALSIPGMVAYLVLDTMETSLEKTAYFIYTTFVVNALMKLACCLYNIQKIRRVLKYLESYYPKTAQERKDCNLDEHLQRIRKYNKGLTIYHLSVTTMFNSIPLVQGIVLYYLNEERTFPYELPFPILYPFNIKNFWAYTFVYTTQCSGAFIISCAFLGSDLLLISCVHLVNMNFAHLYKSIMEFKPNGTLNDMKKLKKFVMYHDDILRTVELIDDTFNISTLLNYVGTVTFTCLLNYQLLAGTGFLHLIKFLAFLISIITHIFFISIFGTEMITLSSNISEAFAYHSWFDGHIQYKRMLLLPIAKAQRPAELHASKFFVISMESFQSLMSISYQFFTLIKTRYEQN